MSLILKCALALWMCAVAFIPASASAQEDPVARINLSRLVVYPEGGQLFTVPRVPEMILPVSLIEETVASGSAIARTICVPKEPNPICLNIAITQEVLEDVQAHVAAANAFCVSAGGGSCGGGMTTTFFNLGAEAIEVFEVDDRGQAKKLFIGGSIRCEIDVTI